MIFHETKLPGACLLEIEPHRDARGFFARSFCRDEFEARGLAADWVQSNISFNAKQGTLRGMHWQVGPEAETKLVRCTQGAIHDVIVDLRPDSETLGQWAGFELSAANRRALYVPEGFAHGFLTLRDECEVFYEMGARHRPEAARGFRWDDPAVGIDWPHPPRILSERDARFPDLPKDLRGVLASTACAASQENRRE
ncbi:MAG TPA: dTDP-4-dehydrorhamnose 3,5-epimerase [Deltaproteobacteria bacterium]|nr:dTDP-4-dehydrorhamnose 3,5-epimerase [Deltaproteobacteria bacterium]